jgi:hypothetical protein
MGAVWENGEGASGELAGAANADLGELKDLLRELVEGQKKMVAEVKTLGVIVGDGLETLAEAMMWGREPERDAEDYSTWKEEFNAEEMKKEADLLMEDTCAYWLYMKGIMDKQKEEMESREVEEMV